MHELDIHDGALVWLAAPSNQIIEETLYLLSILTIYHHNMRSCFNYQKIHVYVLCALTQYLYFLRLYYVLKVSDS